LGKPKSLQASATSPNGISGWVIYADGNNVYQVDNNLNTLTAAVPLQPGTHSILIRAWDKISGYGSSPSFSVTVTTLDVNVVTPASGATLKSPVTVQANAITANGVAGWVIYSDGNNVYQVDNNSNRLSASVNLPVGTHTIMVRAWDKVSGYVSSPKFTINVLSGTNPGPQTAWIVATLPNPQMTPNWRSYAPSDCASDPDACTNDHRFWEEWDFSPFKAGIDASFTAIASQGKYQGVIVVMPLADSSLFWSNIQLIYNSAAAHGLSFQPVLFPKFKYGSGEWCYLYSTGAPSVSCQIASGTTALAYQQLLKEMNFIQNLGGACSSGTYTRPVSIWYGWSSEPGYDVLSRFWNSLSTSGCNLRASYVTWLDTPYTTVPEVKQLQRFHVGRHCIEPPHAIEQPP
jgi:hypothetical protein